MFSDSESVKEHIVLRTQAKAVSDAPNVFTNVKPVNQRRAIGWWEKACKRTVNMVKREYQRES